MLETKNEQYGIGEDLVISIDNTLEPMDKGFGLVIMSGEKKTPGAKEGSDEEYSHEIKETINFKDKEDLLLAQMGLELIQQALVRNEELKEETTED